MKKHKKLTAKQQRFVDEYLIDLNATQAAIRAGYSKKTAKSIGQENLTKPDIQVKIEEARAKLFEKIGIDQERTIFELANLAFSNMGDFVKWGPEGITIIDSKGLTADQKACVAEMSETITQHGGTKRIKLHSKERALELLGRHLGMFLEKPEQSDEKEKIKVLREFTAALLANDAMAVERYHNETNGEKK